MNVCTGLIPYSAKFGGGKSWRIWRNECHLPIFHPARFTKVANVSYCKFANIFLAKTLKQLICQSFTPSEFCAIRYGVSVNYSGYSSCDDCTCMEAICKFSVFKPGVRWSGFLELLLSANVCMHCVCVCVCVCVRPRGN